MATSMVPHDGIVQLQSDCEEVEAELKFSQQMAEDATCLDEYNSAKDRIQTYSNILVGLRTAMGHLHIRELS